MKKIMFNDKYGLTEAVLTGNKTMTRRMVKLTLHTKDKEGVFTEISPDKMFFNEEGVAMFEVNGNVYQVPKESQPAYKIGEEVAVAQSYQTVYDAIEERDGNSKANEWWSRLCDRSPKNPQFLQGYRNKMFTAAELMPYRLKITNIKAERLQDISDNDCFAEGVRTVFDTEYGKWYCHVVGFEWLFDTCQEAFAALIDRISGRGAWEANPWVYAYEFELIK